jgi:hypothetical protein
MSECASQPLFEKRRKLFTRLTAVGFIVLILGGNIWLVLGLLGSELPFALRVSAGLGVGLVAMGGLGLLGQAVMQRIFSVISRNN